MELPLVSIIVPTKNSSEFLERCLLSIRAQTYPSIELIVVDNFSTDNTQEIARRFTEKVFEQGPERSPQRNYGVKLSTGTLVAIIDSDMELAPTVISECVSSIQLSSETVGIVIPEESFGVGFWAECKKLERSFYEGIGWMEAARFFRKEIYVALGGYNPNLISGEDWDLSQRGAALGALKRIQSKIFHNEGEISLTKTIRKKYYYAQNFSAYIDQHSSASENQINIFSRYKLFLSKPRKLFSNPVIGIGMLFMKSLEFFFGGLGYLMAPKRQENLDLIDESKYPFVFFIMPTFNAGKYLHMCLDSISQQEYPKDRYEIVISDGYSTDDTLDIIKNYNVILCYNAKINSDYGRYEAIVRAKGEILVVIDSDNVLVGKD